MIVLNKINSDGLIGLLIKFDLINIKTKNILRFCFFDSFGILWMKYEFDFNKYFLNIFNTKK